MLSQFETSGFESDVCTFKVVEPKRFQLGVNLMSYLHRLTVLDARRAKLLYAELHEGLSVYDGRLCRRLCLLRQALVALLQADVM